MVRGRARRGRRRQRRGPDAAAARHARRRARARAGPRAAARRGAVALKIDEAPLVINAAFAQTLALKRSAGLETVACWQTDAQWEPELREQLDALFAHRVLFATASATDARAASALLMSEYSDQLRAGDERARATRRPRTSACTFRATRRSRAGRRRAGRERPFIATTIPLPLDRERIDWHAREQARRGGRELPEPEPPPELAIAALPSPPHAMAPGATAPAPGSLARAPAPRATAPPPAAAAPAPSHLELQAIDGARRVRWLPVAGARARPSIDPADLPVLAFLAARAVRRPRRSTAPATPAAR